MNRRRFIKLYGGGVLALATLQACGGGGSGETSSSSSSSQCSGIVAMPSTFSARPGETITVEISNCSNLIDYQVGFRLSDGSISFPAAAYAGSTITLTVPLIADSNLEEFFSGETTLVIKESHSNQIIQNEVFTVEEVQVVAPPGQPGNLSRFVISSFLELMEENILTQNYVSEGTKAAWGQIDVNEIFLGVSEQELLFSDKAIAYDLESEGINLYNHFPYGNESIPNFKNDLSVLSTASRNYSYRSNISGLPVAEVGTIIVLGVCLGVLIWGPGFYLAMKKSVIDPNVKKVKNDLDSFKLY